MIRILAGAVFLLAAPAHAQPSTTQGGPMPAPIVFFDIAGTDLASQKAFWRRRLRMGV